MFGYYKLISNSKSASIAVDYPPIKNIRKSQLKDIIPTGLFVLKEIYFKLHARVQIRVLMQIGEDVNWSDWGNFQILPA